ncbi:Electron transfer flavoprotein-ubiquinone oxidoreductase [Citrus sinensis]|nr:Electron transfer flavoprotein-ubiquinone oxidoreductase [Citrus sinensis]
MHKSLSNSYKFSTLKRHSGSLSPFVPSIFRLNQTNNLQSQSSLTNSIKTPSGYSPFRHFNQNPCFFSSGYFPNGINFKGFGRNESGVSCAKLFFRSFCSEMCRESMAYDVVIVGAGPAGLSAAIRLKQLCREKNVDLSVCVVEKGAEVGAHIISGNVFEPRALNELLPQWKQEEAPIRVPVSSDKFWFLTKDRAFSLPSPFSNRGNYVISLSQLVRWLGGKAEELGVEIYPGFAASEILYDADNKVIGIGTNDMGIAKDGSKKENFQRGVELRGRITLLAEGCRGSLSEKLIKNFKLREKSHAQHQTYALGIKEVWEIDEGKHNPGEILHTLGWPLDQKTYGGSFLYHMNDRQIALGLVVALNYHNPFLNPYEEFQECLQPKLALVYYMRTRIWRYIGTPCRNHGCGKNSKELETTDLYILRGKSPYTLKHGKPDHEATDAARLHSPIEYPKPDGVLSFDVPTSLHRSNTNHEHDQPAHLRLRDPKIPELVNLPEYAGPESRYCPARVYEYVPDEKNQVKLQINAQNCLHCKDFQACDIKDPKQNIKWTVPEGGGGPGYSVM